MEVLVNEENVFGGIFFQDVQMQQIFSAYPELVCVDATYKLLELRLPLYIMLVEDGNGESEVAAAFLLLEETEESLSKVLEIFKRYNDSWESIRVIMTDKDLTERDVLSSSFPQANLLICLFHTFRTFRREISVEKMGITSGQRNMCLELLQQMAYSPTEDKYHELYSQFKNCAPPAVVTYFEENWHPIKNQWTMGMKYSTGNFLNGTNNRLESLNAKLKSVISRYSSLEEFFDKFFLILRVLRSERDHKASLSVQKVPVLFHSPTESASVSYIQYLTPYAYKFVAKQMELKSKVKLTSDNGQFSVSTSEGTKKVNEVTCECMSYQSMKLPCRHVLAVRVNLGFDLFDEDLCDNRWSLSYYKSKQRIFLDGQEHDSSLSVVTVAPPPKKLLSQVCALVITWLRFSCYSVSLFFCCL